ncbi:MAG: hypothetical protein ACRDRI_20475 [Pseudonocardiaceae bacterium]
MTRVPAAGDEPAGTWPPTLTPHGVEHVIATLERLRELLPTPPGDGHDQEPHHSETDR